jgi:UDP-GlcNAc:undecaprenyl-phosphate GlcNAc-1-phosphate transferase
LTRPVPNELFFALGFLLVAVATPPLARLAPRFGLLDRPGGHKNHTTPVPVVGGIAMGLAFITCFATLALSREVSVWLPAAAAIMIFCGVLDDRHALSSMPKFGLQILAAYVLARYGGATLAHLGELLRPEILALGALALPFTVFAIVGVMNALNMTDGVDGLAGGVSLVSVIAFAYCAGEAGYAQVLVVACLLAGALGGFLLYNARVPGRRRAVVFMGDAGSYFLGLVLAWMAITLAMGNRPALSPMTAVWILGVPLADTVVLLLRRTLRGRNPFRPDREHLHHLLLARGLSHGAVCAIVVGVSALMALAGVVAEHAGVPEFVMFYLYGALWLVYYVTASYSFRPRRQAETGLATRRSG